MKKEEIIELLKSGHILEQYKTQDFGTTSLTRPIKRTGHYTISYRINGKRIHHLTGASVMKSLKLKEISQTKTLGGYVKSFKMEGHE